MVGHTVYLGLGSNLNRPLKQLRQAVNALQQVPQCRLISYSSIYTSPPLGPAIQPRFLNAVVEMRSTLAPLSLLGHLQTLEKSQGRQKRQRWGPRSLDIDILLYANQSIRLPGLQIPHPQLCRRNFVVQPLLEIAPQLQLPNGKLLIDCAQSLEKITATSLPLRS